MVTSLTKVVPSGPYSTIALRSSNTSGLSSREAGMRRTSFSSTVMKLLRVPSFWLGKIRAVGSHPSKLAHTAAPARSSNASSTAARAGSEPHPAGRQGGASLTHLVSQSAGKSYVAEPAMGHWKAAEPLAPEPTAARFPGKVPRVWLRTASSKSALICSLPGSSHPSGRQGGPGLSESGGGAFHKLRNPGGRSNPAMLEA
mmetsp:Transcript_1128/g.4579  ORF Transcript_1128/g.4579 Transcript_1128/m.4579 type:complete len:200 (-) Transcript_1128:4822-5421(-)